MTIAERLVAVRSRIREAARACGRDPSGFHLIAVSKMHPPEAITEAYAAGQRAFGENYAQEFSAKVAALAHLTDVEWHFIGHLQTNKVKLLAGCHTVHSIDSLRLAEALASRNVALRTFVEVNLGGEASKSGCPEALMPTVVDRIRSASMLTFAGLMTMPPPGDRALAAQLFARLEHLARAIRRPGEKVELSMGMSEDLEVAVAHGATQVRIGTAIFGRR